MEKTKQTLEAENSDLATELRNVNQSRQEYDFRRKQANASIAELQVSLSFPIEIKNTANARYFFLWAPFRVLHACERTVSILFVFVREEQ